MSQLPKAIVSVTNDLYTDQRVNKICLFLVKQGYEVTLVGRKRRTSVPLNKRPYRTKRMPLLFEKGALFYAAFNLRLFFYVLFHRADLLVSNDLDTLLANHWAKKMKRNCRLVYDSHEYFTEVPELTCRPRVQRIWERIEKSIFPQLETVYTVNHSIAEIYQKKYHKDVLVVRNISEKWTPDHLMSKKELGIPINEKLIILQGAGINVDRGAEEAIEAMKTIDGVLMVVGDGDVVSQLKEKVKSLQLDKKVLFFGKKPYSIMMQYTHYADIGLTLDKPSNLNYKLSLPNKVFDYMHAGTAVIATDIKEVAHVVNTHKLGIVLDEFNAENLAKAISNLLQNEELLATYQQNCITASEVENWEHETQILEKIYPKID